MLTLLLALVAGQPAADTLPSARVPDYAPRLAVLAPRRFTTAAPSFAPYAPSDTLQRPRAVVLSDGYYTRLKIHRIASYATLPLFAAQYLAGEELYRHPADPAGWARDLHSPLAAAIGVLFVTNTVTGVWNLVESRKVPEGRTRRTLHSVLMLAADAGFVAVAGTAPESEGGEREGEGNRSLHKGLAIGSMSAALGSYLMMLLWKD